MRIRSFLFLSALVILGCADVMAVVRYVKPTPTGSGNGSSWNNASGDLQLMINSSAPGDEVWVAAGTYHAIRRVDNLNVISPGDRQNAFVGKSGVNLYGGFAGTETSIEQRDLTDAANATVLSADLNEDDGTDFSNMTDNAFHVMVFTGPVLNAIFDGFTIASAYYREGVDDWEMPTVNGHVVHNHFGGALYVFESSPILSNLVFTKNNLHLGSGLLTYGSGTTSRITNCVFHHNRGYFGAAMLNYYSSPQFYNTLIYDNEALYDETLTPSLRGGEGGAVYNWGANPVFVNATIVNNSAATRGGGFFHSGGTITMRNSILYGNSQKTAADPAWQHQVFNSGATVNLNNNIIQDWDGSGNGNNLNSTGVDVTELFEDYEGQNFYLNQESIAANAGQNSYVAGILSDLDGNSRILDDIVDLGVYEGRYTIPSSVTRVPDNPVIVRLQPNPTDGNSQLAITSNQGRKGSIRIYNETGEMVKNLPLYAAGGHQLIALESENWTRGIYLINITWEDHTGETIRLIRF